MFVAVFRCIFWGLVLPLPHLIIHPVQERILTTCLILLRCKNPSHRFQQWTCPCAVRSERVSPFYLPSIHQIRLLRSCAHDDLALRHHDVHTVLRVIGLSGTLPVVTKISKVEASLTIIFLPVSPSACKISSWSSLYTMHQPASPAVGQAA